MSHTKFWSIVCFIFFCSFSLPAQVISGGVTPEKDIVEHPDTPPEFPGGDKAMYAQLSKVLKYPALAKKNNVQGTVMLNLLIDKYGDVCKIDVVKGLGGGCTNAAISAVKKLPKFQPGLVDNKRVKSWKKVPFVFQTYDSNKG